MSIIPLPSIAAFLLISHHPVPVPSNPLVQAVTPHVSLAMQDMDACRLLERSDDLRMVIETALGKASTAWGLASEWSASLRCAPLPSSLGREGKRPHRLMAWSTAAAHRTGVDALPEVDLGVQPNWAECMDLERSQVVAIHGQLGPEWAFSCRPVAVSEGLAWKPVAVAVSGSRLPDGRILPHVAFLIGERSTTPVACEAMVRGSQTAFLGAIALDAVHNPGLPESPITETVCLPVGGQGIRYALRWTSGAPGGRPIDAVPEVYQGLDACRVRGDGLARAGAQAAVGRQGQGRTSGSRPAAAAPRYSCAAVVDVNGNR